MQKVLIIGAGRSSSVLIQYLEENAARYGWHITVADMDLSLVMPKISEGTRALALDIFDEEKLNEEIAVADIVISLVPARFHMQIALSCLNHSRTLLTASYESREMADLDTKARARGILFLNELGVDPGLDHMSAMKMIGRVRNSGHRLLGFESFTGGLIAPESDNNPWHYKFTWNPRNIVVAGQDGPARFIQEGTIKFIPYHRLFRRTEIVDIEGYGKFEGYANRDSLRYIEKYHLQDVPTVYRGTLRRPGFCRAWDVFVQLGITDDTYTLIKTEDMTYKEFINSFLYYSREDSVKTKLYQYMHIDQDSDVREKLEWLGIFDDTKIGIKDATPARILEHILSKKWALETHDKDMLVMFHKLLYQDKTSKQAVLATSSLVVIGEDPVRTAMAKTVGLPLGIAAKMILTGQISLQGVHIPTHPEIYNPLLHELENYNIRFHEKESPWKGD
jgi:saccharopine dehydrogenase (NAD+, L-glutamate forming)